MQQGQTELHWVGLLKGEHSQTNREMWGGVGGHFKNRITSDYRQHNVHKTDTLRSLTCFVILRDKDKKKNMLHEG